MVKGGASPEEVTYARDMVGEVGEKSGSKLGQARASHLCLGHGRTSPSSLCLILLAGQQEVGHEDVATGRGAFSLRSLGPSAFLLI